MKLHTFLHFLLKCFTFVKVLFYLRYELHRTIFVFAFAHNCIQSYELYTLLPFYFMCTMFLSAPFLRILHRSNQRHWNYVLNLFFKYANVFCLIPFLALYYLQMTFLIIAPYCKHQEHVMPCIQYGN